MKRIAAAFMAIVLLFMISACSSASGTYLYKSKDGDWSINMPKEFIKDKEESNEGEKSYTVTFKTENETYLAINEKIDADLQLSEETIKEEMELDHYLEVSRYETIDLKGGNKAYGVVLNDKATGMSIIYYRIKNNEKVISYMLYRKGGFTVQQEAKAQKMISSFKAL